MIEKVLGWLGQRLFQVWSFCSGLIRYLIRAISRLRIAIFVAFLLGAAVFVTSPPAGTIVWLHRAEAVPDISQPKFVLRRALSATNKRISLSNTTRAMFDPEFAEELEITEYFGPSRLEELLEASVDVEITDGPLKATLGVDAVALLQTVVDRLLLRPSSVVIIDAHRKTDETELMILTAYRSASREIAATQQGDADQLEEQMVEGTSDFLIEHYFDTETDCRIQLCGLHFPHETREIDSVAQAFTALSSRQYVGLCEGISDQLECINAIKTEVETLSSNFIVRDMLLFLHSLRNLQFILEDRPQATDALGAALDELHQRVVRINNTPQFEMFLQSDEALSHFLQSSGLTDLNLTASFLRTAHFYQEGRFKLQSGERAAAVEAFLSISSPPEWFQPYLLSVIIHQAFDPESMSFDEAMTYIKQVANAGLEADYIRHAIVGVLYQRLIAARLESEAQATRDQLIEDALSVWGKAVETTNSEYDRIGAQLELARTQYLIGQASDARSTFEDVLPVLRSSEPGDVRYRLAFVSAAAVSALLEEFPDTQWLLERAFSLHPRNVCAYSNLEEFDGFRDYMGDGHNEWIASQRAENGAPC